MRGIFALFSFVTVLLLCDGGRATTNEKEHDENIPKNTTILPKTNQEPAVGNSTRAVGPRSQHEPKRPRKTRDKFDQILKTARRFQKHVTTNYLGKDIGHDNLIKLLKRLSLYFSYIREEFHIELRVSEERSLAITKLKQLVARVRSRLDGNRCANQCADVWEILKTVGAFLFDGAAGESSSQGEIMQIVQILESYSYYIKYVFSITFSRQETLELLKNKIQQIYNDIALLEDDCKGACHKIREVLSRTTWLSKHIHAISEERIKMLLVQIQQYNTFIQSKFHISLTNIQSKKQILNLIKHLFILVSDERNCLECKQIKSTLIAFKDIMMYVKLISKMENLQEAINIVAKHKIFIERTYQITITIEESEEIILTKIESLKRFVSNSNQCRGPCREIRIAVQIVESNSEFAVSVNSIRRISETLQILQRHSQYIEQNYRVVFHVYESVETIITKIEELIIKLDSHGSRCSGPCHEIRNAIKFNYELTRQDQRINYLIQTVKKYKIYIQQEFHIAIEETDTYEVILSKINQIKRVIDETPNYCAGANVPEPCNEIKPIFESYVPAPDDHSHMQPIPSDVRFQHLIHVMMKHSHYIEQHFHIEIKQTDSFEVIVSKINRIKEMITSNPNLCAGANNADPCREMKPLFDWYEPNPSQIQPVIADRNVKELIEIVRSHENYVKEQFHIEIYKTDSYEQILSKMITIREMIRSNPNLCAGSGSPCEQMKPLLPHVPNYPSQFQPPVADALPSHEPPGICIPGQQELIQKQNQIIISQKESLREALSKIEELKVQLSMASKACESKCAGGTKNLVSPMEIRNEEVKRIAGRLEHFNQFIRETFHVNIDRYESETVIWSKIEEIKRKIISHPQCVGRCKEILDIIGVAMPEPAANFSPIAQDPASVQPVQQIVYRLEKYRRYIKTTFNIVIEQHESQEIITQKLTTIWMKIKNDPQCTGVCAEIRDILAPIQGYNPHQPSRQQPSGCMDPEQCVKGVVKELEQFKQYIVTHYQIVFEYQESYEITIQKVEQLRRRIYFDRRCSDVCNQIKVVFSRSASNIEESMTRKIKETVTQLLTYQTYITDKYQITFSVQESREIIIQKIRRLIYKISSGSCDHTCQQIKVIVANFQKSVFTSQNLLQAISQILVHKMFIETTYNIFFQMTDSEEVLWRKMVELWKKVNSAGTQCSRDCIRIREILASLAELRDFVSSGALSDEKIVQLYNELLVYRDYIEAKYSISLSSFDETNVKSGKIKQLVTVMNSVNKCDPTCETISALLATIGGFQMKNNKIQRLLEMLQRHRRYIESTFNLHLWDIQTHETVETRITTLVKKMRSMHAQCVGECVQVREILIKFGGYSFGKKKRKCDKMLKRVKQFQKHVRTNYSVR